MSKLRLDPETLRVKSFQTDAATGRIRGTVRAHSQTTATDYWTTLCGGGGGGDQYPTTGCQIGTQDPVDPNQKYRLPQLDQ